MTAYRLDRTDDLPLAFEGELVAEADSYHPLKERWTVLRLYVVDDGRFVVESVGETSVAGEVTLRSANVCASVGDVIAQLRKSDNSRGTKRSYIPAIGWRVLEQAHDNGAIVLPTVETV